MQCIANSLAATTVYVGVKAFPVGEASCPASTARCPEENNSIARPIAKANITRIRIPSSRRAWQPLYSARIHKRSPMTVSTSRNCVQDRESVVGSKRYGPKSPVRRFIVASRSELEQDPPRRALSARSAASCKNKRRSRRSALKQSFNYRETEANKSECNNAWNWLSSLL